MKRFFLWLALLGLTFALGSLVTGHYMGKNHARRLAARQKAWETDKANLEAALRDARAPRPAPAPLILPALTPAPLPAPFPDPRALMNRLVALPVIPGQNRTLRPVISLLDQLAQCGDPALPVIRTFLALNQDIIYDAPSGKGARDVKALAGALFPRSLRFGLFDAIQQIGGPEAERLLADILNVTGLGVEIAYLTDLLESMAPGRYMAMALATARDLLANGQSQDPADREYLYAVLRRFNDASFIGAAQARLVGGDGKLDRGALRYLQQTLGNQSLPIVAQAYHDARVTEAESREPLARVALAYVGADDQALQLYHTAVLDQTLKPDHRRELVEDLNQDGLSNRKDPTPADLEVIAHRYQLTQTYLDQDYVQNDPVLLKAFREADKDLRKLLERAAAAAGTGASVKQ